MKERVGEWAQGLDEEARASLDYLGILLFARMYLFEMFHKVFGGKPTPELLEVLCACTTLDALDEYATEEEVEGKLRDYLLALGQRENRAALLWDIEAEYTRVLVGPGRLPAPLWESPYLSKEASLMQESTLAVRSMYRSFGLEPVACGHVPDDHVSLLCYFAAIRARAAYEAFCAGSWELLRDLMVEQCAFGRDHLVAWIPEFAARLCHVDGAVLYPQVGKGLAGFVQRDCDMCANAITFLGEWLASGGCGLPSEVVPVEVEADYERLCAVRLYGLKENELRAV